MVRDVAVSYSPIDGKLARTMVALAARPGELLEAYRNGAGSRYVTPLKLFVAMTAMFLAVMNFSGTTLYQSTWKAIAGQTPTAVFEPLLNEVIVRGAIYTERWLQPQVEAPVDASVVAAMQRAGDAATDPLARAAFRLEATGVRTEELANQRLSAWLPNVIWLLMPLHALLLAPLFGRRRLFLEHVIFAMWAHAVLFMAMMAVALANSRDLNLPGWLVVAPYQAYFTIAAARYYAKRPLSALWRGTVHTTAYCLLVLLPVSMAIYVTGVDWTSFTAWMLA